MGEAKRREVAMHQQVVEALGLQTAGGQIKVRWDANGQASAQGQIAYSDPNRHPFRWQIGTGSDANRQPLRSKSAPCLG